VGSRDAAVHVSRDGGSGWVGGRGRHPADDFHLYTPHAAPFCDCRRPPACANYAAQAAPALDDALSTAICTASTGDMDAHGWVVTASQHVPDMGVGGWGDANPPPPGHPARRVCDVTHVVQ